MFEYNKICATYKKIISGYRGRLVDTLIHHFLLQFLSDEWKVMRDATDAAKGHNASEPLNIGSDFNFMRDNMRTGQS